MNDQQASATAMPPGFATALFARTAREDLMRYEVAALAQLASAAWQHLQAPRQRGVPAVRVTNPAASHPQLAAVTIIEAVNDDMAFLLDSTLAELADMGLDIRLVAHPIMAVGRDAQGRMAQGPAEERESLIHIHVARIADEAQCLALQQALMRIYADVTVSVQDWAAMRSRIGTIVEQYRRNPPPLRADEIAEAVQFLDWLARDNFIYLGLRDYAFVAAQEGQPPVFDAVGGSGLGTLRDPDVRVLRRGRELVALSPEVLEFLHDSHALIITKANVKSRVHRRTQMDYVGVKLFSPEGHLLGELRIVGLFTAGAYTQGVATIPVIRHKVAHVLEEAGLDAASHSGKVLLNVLETYPRDELFQIDVATLAQFAAEIASLYERPRLRVLARPDRFDRFVSVLAFIPRDRYDTRVRLAVGAYLKTVFQGRVSAVYPFYPDGPLVRTHYIIGRDDGTTPIVSRAELEAGIAAIIRTWGDDVREALVAAHGDAGHGLAQLYAPAFSAGYREAFNGGVAVADIATIQHLDEASPRAAVAYRAAGASLSRADLKVFSRGRPMPLSERVPLLEHMGFRVVSEQTFDILASGEGGAGQIWLHDMTLERANGAAVDLETCGPRIEAALMAIFAGQAESDGYNGLILEGLGWRDIAILRTLSLYLRQIRVRFSQDYMWETLNRNAAIAVQLVALLHRRFDPALDQGRAETEAILRAEIETGLAGVASLDEDRILRRFLNLADASLRTNIFQREADGTPRATISFKFDSRKIDGLPLPSPLYEITVYSPRVEGIHLRFGKVARGGLRWSDRPQDFRTEILGLVKAQQVKNAVIVPVGAKGGFVPKHLPAPGQRDAYMAEGIAAYRIFVSALLDLTDNIEGATLVPPQDTVRHDGDDPYLVVAADKGTATFSDIANGISIQHRHWLGDAFASGGSVGYDHKKMGITARGAWEAVKRHFREIDRDIQGEAFTVAGVGDMSGDVFGNGLLLSPHIMLIAAFDHHDIFLDPDPDAALSLKERARLFALPRSSWQDYDKSLISPGGGVFSRSLKQVALSPQVQVALGLHKASAAPAEILIAILTAPVDLLWFGGIGTYVRASSETDDMVGDRANDAIRIAGAELRCKVIGEGANLGMTQRGRIEAALAGVRLNTDAIDNSAGVNTSDVEVNIKIALSGPLRSGGLDMDSRNQLLASMTDEVGALVLRNNYQQTLALSLAQRRGTEDIGFAKRFMQKLEREKRLDRTVEFLPDDAALTARSRAGQGLTRPELAVLLAYAKLSLNEDLLVSDVPDDPWLARELTRYFPPALCQRFPDAVRDHRLHREIVATALSNALINRGGPTLLIRIGDETGADAASICRAFATVREAYSLTELNGAIDALDAKMPGDLQLELYASVQALLISRLVWFIRNADFSTGLENVSAGFRQGVQELSAAIGAVVPERLQVAMAARISQLGAAGVPVGLAQHLAALPHLSAAPDIVLVAGRTGETIGDVAATFFATDEAFGLGALVQAGQAVAVSDYYDRLALDRALDQIESAHRHIAMDIVSARTGAPGEDAVSHWLAAHDASRIRTAVSDIVASGLTLSKLTVAASLLGDVVRG